MRCAGATCPTGLPPCRWLLAVAVPVLLLGPAIEAQAQGRNARSCAFSTAGLGLNFGTLDPSAPQQQVRRGQLEVSGCQRPALRNIEVAVLGEGEWTSGTSARRTLQHSNPLKGGIPYSLNLRIDPPLRAEKDATVRLEAVIQPAAYAQAQPGDYADTLTLLVLP